MTATPRLPAAFASASSLFRSPRNGSKKASQGSAACAAKLTASSKTSLTAAVIGPNGFRRAGDIVFEAMEQAGTLLDQRGELLVAACDRPRVVADFRGELGDAPFQL